MTSSLLRRCLAAAIVLLLVLCGSLVLGDGIDAALRPDVHSKACPLCILAFVLAGLLVLGSAILLQTRTWRGGLETKTLSLGLAPAIVLHTRSPPWT